jgi:hypothetical protein
MSGVRLKPKNARPFNVIWVVQSAGKNIPLFEQVETAIERRDPVPDKEGRFAIVTIRWVRDAMDAMTHETNALIADGEAVWS